MLQRKSTDVWVKQKEERILYKAVVGDGIASCVYQFGEATGCIWA